MTSGGRVLCVTATAADLDVARLRAYQAVDVIDIPGSHYRFDIASAAVRGDVVVPVVLMPPAASRENGTAAQAARSDAVPRPIRRPADVRAVTIDPGADPT